MKIGVVIGRFQVPKPHKGHVMLFSTARGQCDRLVVLLGVSGLDTHLPENPYSYAQREVMLGTNIPYLTVLPIQDHRSDKQWSLNVDELLSSTFPHDTITLFHGRESGIVGHYMGRFPLVELPVHVDERGADLRKNIIEQTDPRFMLGQAFALERQFPTSYQAVDIAAVKRTRHDPEEKVLVIQRADGPESWCFPGGFVDPTDASLEAAARREFNEELGVSAEDVEYIGSFRINDWRYRSSRHKILSAFFVSHFTHGILNLEPSEVRQANWLPLSHFAHDLQYKVSEAHQPLMKALLTKKGLL